MSIDPLAFLDEPTSSQSPMSSDPLSFLDEPAQERMRPRDAFKEFTSRKPPHGRNILADLATAGTSILGTPGDIASIFGGDNPITSQNLRKKSFEIFPSLAPKNEQEAKWDEGLSAVMGLATPGGPFKAAGKFVGKGIGKATPFLKGKYKELYEIGKQIGISDKALAPFRHGKVSETFLKQMSKLGKEAQEGVKFAENLATPKYQQIEAAASKLPVNQISSRSVVRGLQDVINDIQKSPALVKESKDVVKFLEDAIEGISSNPNLNAENLIALQKQLGKTVNWTSIKQAGKGHLVKRAKDAVMTGVYGTSPAIGRELDSMDKLYAGYKKLAKEVSPSKMYEFATKGGPIGAGFLALLTGHDPSDSVKAALGAYLGTKAVGKIGGKLLTDPKWVGVKEKMVDVVKNQSFDKIPKLMVAIKKKAAMDRSLDLDELDKSFEMEE